MVDRSALLDLAYEEYCHRREAAESVDIDQFLDRYASVRSSLRRQIEVHDVLAACPVVGDLAQPVDWPIIGTRILDFTVQEELGRGAFARAYLCVQEGLGDRQVVVKLAREGAYEAEMLGRLSHPNIMPIYSVGFDEFSGASAICMPFRGRATLCQLIDKAFAGGHAPQSGSVICDAAVADRRPTDVVDDSRDLDPFLRRCSYVDGIIHLGIQLADAIAHAHSRGIRHGDLKPSNILLTPAGKPLLLDFNLASLEAARFKLPGGTVPYMSPEQLELFLRSTPVGATATPSAENATAASATAVDIRSDLFSLGVILYEAFCGRLPFGEVTAGPGQSEHARELLTAQRRGPRSLREANRAIDARLAHLIHRCLQYDPALRPSSAAALALELRQCRTPLRRARRWSIAHQVFVCALLAVSAAGVIGGAFYCWQRDPYDQRQYLAAQTAFAHKDNAAAMAYATNAIEAKPQRTDALELRAFARIASGDFSGALLDIQAAAIGKPSARMLALEGYCQIRLKLHREAGERYRRAVNAGYQQVDGWNNLAFYQANFGSLTEAKRLLDIAANDPSAPYQVHLNRAIVELRAAYKNQPHDLPAAIHDVERAIQLHGPNADMELLAARLSALAARNDAAYVAGSLSHLEKASALGLATKPTTLAADPDFAVLRSQPRFQQVMGRLPTATTSPPPDRIIAPSLKS